MRSRVIGALAGALLLMAGATACGDKEPRTADGESSSTAGETATSPNGSAPPTEVEPSVKPATGELTGLEGMLTFRLTDDLDWQFDEDGGATYARAWTGSEFISVLADDNRTPTDTLEEEFQVNFEVDAETSVYRLRKAGYRTVAGSKGWVIRGTAPRGERYYQWGTVKDGRTVTFDFEYNSGDKGAQDVIEAVLASIEWE